MAIIKNFKHVVSEFQFIGINQNYKHINKLHNTTDTNWNIFFLKKSTTSPYIRKIWYVGLRKHKWIKMTYNKLQDRNNLFNSFAPNRSPNFHCSVISFFVSQPLIIPSL
jgi:hypothetical protein